MSAAALEQARNVSLEDAVTNAQVLITTGAGGVGKTTTAAALGLAAARQGRRALVVTIDPARRLAQAMGLTGLTDAPVAVLDTGSGELWAMMLDVQSTFDRLIDRHAATDAKARAIKHNRIYRSLSSTLSGTQEYMAMERLYELHQDGEFDVLVVDTPPTRSALDFLDAPKRMTSFLEGRLLTAMLKPGMLAGRGIGRVVGAGASAFMRVAGRVAGTELLADLADFFHDFDGMYSGFKDRAEHVLALLREPGTRFVVVSSPQPAPLREARFFLERLEQEGLHSAGVVINRIRPLPPRDPSTRAIARAAGALNDGSAHDHAAGAALRLLEDVRQIAGRERRDVSAALYNTKVRALLEVPLLRGDIHDLDGLEHIATILSGSRR